ncbi:MAG: hypoxanthine phosphoribosyltransferase [Acidobacteria bacterium]|nr:hypoxanthine phosphoribosyltransferase [Acidobacteriota bacterium]
MAASKSPGVATELLSTSALDEIVGRLGAEIDADGSGPVLLVGVLRGSVVFLADLIRKMHREVYVDFLAVSSYTPGAGRVRLLKDLDEPVSGIEVVLVSDLIDTGLTTRYLIDQLRARGAAGVKVCSLFSRPQRRVVPVAVDFLGAEITEDYLVGYGLDHGGRYRNLPAVYALGSGALDKPSSDWPDLE